MLPSQGRPLWGSQIPHRRSQVPRAAVNVLPYTICCAYWFGTAAFTISNSSG